MAAAPEFFADQDILFVILSWLPALSLLPFKNVCKLWNSIIKNPKFIDTHRINSQKRQPSLLRLVQVRDVQEMYIYTCEDSVRLKLPKHCNGTDIHYVRSCDGLVCAADLYAQFICVCNPSTRQSKVLPSPKIKSNHIIGVTLGFGFDFIEKDYKILRMVLGTDGDNGLVQFAEVYSTNAGSWKSIQAPEEVQKFRIYPSGKCVQSKNGVLYLEGNDELLTFDLHNEVLGVYPYATSVHHIKMSDLLDFEGSVAMILKSVNDQSSVPSLWMLDDGQGSLSWNKIFDLEGASQIQWILFYWGFGYFIGFDNDVGCMFYGYSKKETEKPCYPDDVLEDVSFIKYTDSLVSLQGFGQLEW